MKKDFETTTSALTDKPSRLDASEQVRHTDGPWSYSLSAKKRKYHINAESWMQFARVWAGTEGTKHYDAEAKANARLIAAAPDMLAALKAMHDHAVEYARINNLFNSDGSPATFHELLQARAAIAKAEGRSS